MICEIAGREIHILAQQKNVRPEIKATRVVGGAALHWATGENRREIDNSGAGRKIMKQRELAVVGGEAIGAATADHRKIRRERIAGAAR